MSRDYALPTEFPLVESMTDVEIRFNLAGVDAERIALLAEGPWPEPMCGVCRALEDLYGEYPGVAAVIDFHDTPFRRRFGTAHYREGREVFARCLQIYRAMGWPGGD
jgi:hypothetical protein